MSLLSNTTHAIKRLCAPAILAVMIMLPGCEDQYTAPAPANTSQQTAASAPAPQAAIDCDLYFSPRGGCTDAIIKSLDAAKKTVRMQAYSFTSVRIAKALLDAHKRGVDVQVMLDKSQVTQQYSACDFLHNSNISVYIDRAHAIAHNKIIIIDQQIVITGSFNFTKAAEERNAENLLVIRDKDLASRYTENWDEHFQHSEAYMGRY